MTKNIIIGILSTLIVFFIIFANIKAKEAEKQTLLALELAEEYEAKAKSQEQKTVEMAALLKIEERKAEELQAELDKCNN